MIPDKELPFAYVGMWADQEGISSLNVAPTLRKVVEIMSEEFSKPPFGLSSGINIYAVYPSATRRQIRVDKKLYSYVDENEASFSRDKWKPLEDVPEHIEPEVK